MVSQFCKSDLTGLIPGMEKALSLWRLQGEPISLPLLVSSGQQPWSVLNVIRFCEKGIFLKVTSMSLN